MTKMGMKKPEGFRPVYSFGRVSRAEFRALASKQKDNKAKRAEKRRVIFERPLRVTRKGVIAQLDELVSTWVKTRWREISGRCVWHDRHSFRPIECWYHVEPCGNWLIRWLPLNLIGACNPCNGDEQRNRGSARIEDRHRNLIGPKKLEALKELRRIKPKFSLDEYVEMRDEFKKKIEAGDYADFIPAPILRRIPEEILEMMGGQL